jgi:hypothetical protein
VLFFSIKLQNFSTDGLSGFAYKTKILPIVTFTA